jgi:nuclear pore complex protein Nup188
MSGTFYNENQEVVKKKLLDLHEEIRDGVKIFKKPKPDAVEEVEKLLKENGQTKLIPFVRKLQKYLDLDVNQSYNILCYYLVNEYRGSASSLQNFVSNESQMIKLLNDIWFYYTLERMVLLKVVKCILEYHQSTDHPYHQAFKAVIDKIGLAALRKSLIEQFEETLKDVQQIKFLPGDIFNSPQKLQSWSERKHREMNEILQMILLATSFDSIKAEEIQNLLDLFRSHSYGKQNQYLNALSNAHIDMIQKVTYSEVAVLMVALSTNSENSVWVNEVIKKLDDKITGMQHYQEHGPILLSWMLFKFASKKSESTTPEQFNSYGKLGARAVQLNVFENLHKMITHRQYKDKSMLSKTIVQCVCDNLTMLCELFNADGSMAQHPMIFELFSEVLKSSAIAKEFCKNEESPLRTLFNAAVEKFPYDFVPLSLISKSLSLASVQSNNWILQFLHNLPVYAEQPNDPLYELRKCYDTEEDSYALLNDYRPFVKINEFVIPADNSAIVREEKGRMFVYFLTKLNYFHALRNEMHELLNSIVTYAEIQPAKLSRLESGISLLAAIIKRTDSPEDITNEMIHPTEMVFDILEKLKGCQHPALELMAACLNVCAELMATFSDEVFRRFINLNIGPIVTVTHRDFKAYSNGNGFESGLIGFFLIKMESSAGRYSFLKAYFNFLKKCAKVCCFCLINFFIHLHLSFSLRTARNW